MGHPALSYVHTYRREGARMLPTQENTRSETLVGRSQSCTFIWQPYVRTWYVRAAWRVDASIRRTLCWFVNVSTR